MCGSASSARHRSARAEPKLRPGGRGGVLRRLEVALGKVVASRVVGISAATRGGRKAGVDFLLAIPNPAPFDRCPMFGGVGSWRFTLSRVGRSVLGNVQTQRVASRMGIGEHRRERWYLVHFGGDSCSLADGRARSADGRLPPSNPRRRRSIRDSEMMPLPAHPVPPRVKAGGVAVSRAQGWTVGPRRAMSVATRSAGGARGTCAFDPSRVSRAGRAPRRAPCRLRKREQRWGSPPTTGVSAVSFSGALAGGLSVRCCARGQPPGVMLFLL